MGFKGHSLINIPIEELEYDMIKQYKELKIKLNKVPNSRDIIKHSKLNECYSMTAYVEHFGSLYNLQVKCGYIPTRIGKNMNKNEMISSLKKLGEILKRTPTKFDLKDYDFIPSASHYERIFGSYTNALKAAGFKDLKFKTIITNKGTKCYSYFEYKLTKVLENNNFIFKKEVYYKNYISNFNKNYRFDFIIEYNNKNYFIEVFAIINNKNYKEKEIEKINLCKNNSIPLITFYQEDLWGKTNEQIYNLLIKKINEIKL